MKSLPCFLFLLIVLITSFSHSTWAKKKVALVIGNSSYQGNASLKNPSSDAELMAETLQQLGFELAGGKAHTDLSRDEMKKVIIDFEEMILDRSHIGLFYYAGHGIEYKGENYLIPVDMEFTKAKYLEVNAVSLKRITLTMNNNNKSNHLNIMILDACRNNPFPSTERGIYLNSGTKLNNISPKGTIIIYSTRPGEKAQDGDADHSPFTQSLTKHMLTPNLVLEDVLRATVKDVERLTGGLQTPWQEGYTKDRFYFNRTKSLQAAQTQVSMPARSSNKRIRRSRKRSSRSFLKSIPTWGYVALSLGIIAHTSNFLAYDSTNTGLVDASFYGAVGGYAVGVVGIGWGVKEYLSAPKGRRRSRSIDLSSITPTPVIQSNAYSFPLFATQF